MSKAIDAIRGHFNQEPIPKAKCLLDERDRVNAMIDAIEDENKELRKLVQDFDKCLYSAMSAFNSVCAGTVPEEPDIELFFSLRPRMDRLGIEVWGSDESETEVVV